MQTLLQNQLEKEISDGTISSVINLVNYLLEKAHELRASDIHIEPNDSKVRIRMRVDGVMTDAYSFPRKINDEIISRIKILSGLRTDEHQAAQDGRFRVNLEAGLPVDVRVSIAPTYYGENAVLRLLTDKSERHTIESLGFNQVDADKIKRAIRKPYGMILATGPTGSGKTTTLYTLIKMLNTPDVSIVTIEDPIEYSIVGINQIGVNPKTGITFAQGLRSILRQDPNIIMVGEIRDAETAGIAVNTALTGHLLLSSLHTNDSATTLPRLLDMKVEPYLIASTVNVAIAQRLVRKICPHCKKERKITSAEKKSMESLLTNSSGKEKFYFGSGCADCGMTGYKGRIGIYEVMEVDQEIRDAILNKASASDIKKLAIQKGMTTMLQDGYNKATAGITTVEEILRTLNE